MNASMLPYILFSCLLLSVQAQNCKDREVIIYTYDLLKEKSLGCPCRETAGSSCSCLPIAEPGHELACFVEGTEHMLKYNLPSNRTIAKLNTIFQTQWDRNFCESLAHGKQCKYKTKGDVKEFLNKILRTYQSISKRRS